MITNEGKQFFGNRVVGAGENAVDTTNGYFLYSNGTSDPELGDDRAVFSGDGSGGNKVIESSEYETGTKKIKIQGELGSGEGNSPGSITKLGIVNDSAAGKLIAEHKFDVVTKNSEVELYFTLTILQQDSSEY